MCFLSVIFSSQMRSFLEDFLDSFLHPGVHQVEEKGERIEEKRRDWTQVASSSIWTCILGDIDRLFLMMSIDLHDELLVLRGEAERVAGHALYEGWSGHYLTVCCTLLHHFTRKIYLLTTFYYFKRSLEIVTRARLCNSLTTMSCWHV